VGSVFKPTTYKDIPAGAEIVTRKGERIDMRGVRSPIVCFC